MRLLFDLDKKDYDPNGVGFVRHSARCIAIRDGRVAMIYSKRYDYYSFPGGGIEPGETGEQAVIREAAEEAGLAVIPSSVRALGYVHRVSKSAREGVAYFLQDNFYYLCEVEEEPVERHPEAYEEAEELVPEWVEPAHAIRTNSTPKQGLSQQVMLERERRVLELLLREGYFDC